MLNKIKSFLNNLIQKHTEWVRENIGVVIFSDLISMITIVLIVIFNKSGTVDSDFTIIFSMAIIIYSVILSAPLLWIHREDK